MRRDRRVHVARLAIDAARGGAHPRWAAARDVPRGRALRGVLRARRGEGDRPSRRARVHVRDGGGELPAGRRRGARGGRAAPRADRRPPAGAARGRRGPGHRPDRALRAIGAVVRGGRQPPGDARAGAVDAHAGLPRCGCDDGDATRARASQLPAARAARGAGARVRTPRRGDRAARRGSTSPRRRRRRPSRSSTAGGVSSSRVRAVTRASSRWRSAPAGRCSPTR